MAELFRNNSPGALTLEQARALEKKRVAKLRRERQLDQLAAEGRGSDTEIAHVARGEIVLPVQLQNDDVLNAIQHACRPYGVPLEMLRVGNALNSINPNTGAPEFGVMDWIKGLGQKVTEAGKNAGAAALGYVAEPFESDGSPRGVVFPPPSQTSAPPTEASLRYNPNGPSFWDLAKRYPTGVVPAIYHGARAYQEAKDRFSGGPAEAGLQNGGADAWRHTRWNQRMVNAIGAEQAQAFGDWNERRELQNPAGARLMDLENNAIGRRLEGDRSRSTIDFLLHNGQLRTRPY